MTCFSEVEVWDVENGTGQVNEVFQAALQIGRGGWAYMWPYSTD